MYKIAPERNGAYEERTDKGIVGHSKLVPIEGGKGIQSQAGYAAGDRSKLDVLWSNPGDPIEVSHCLDDIVGEPEVDEHGDKTVHEPSHPGYRPSIGCIVGSVVEGTVE